MEIILIILVTILTAIVIAMIFIFLNKFKELKQANKEDKSLLMLNQNIQGMHKRLDNAAKVIGLVNKELGHVQEIGRQMNDLQLFLKSPKLRGNIGELVLNELITKYFPKDYYDIQYKFKTGQIVDAILKTDQGKIGIDSKFPLENFQKITTSENEKDRNYYSNEFGKDIRKHIKDIARKYILPEEGTLNFAIMYVPSEIIFYEIIRHKDNLDEFAQENNIYIVSPHSFYYYLNVLLLGFQGKKIEENSKKVLIAFQAIAKDNDKMGNELGVLNTHLTNATTAMERVSLNYTQLTGKINQIKLLK